MAKVYVLKTKPETVTSDYKRLLHLSDYQKIIPKKYDTILKLNLSWSLYFPACSTEPWQLEGVLDAMVNDGYENIIPVENKTVVTDPWKGAEGNKWLPILKKHNLKFTSLTDVKWINFKPKGEMVAMDKIFPEGFEIPEILIGKNVVHLPTQKTHGHTVMTGAIKNAFGGVLKTKRHHSHRLIHGVLVDILQIQKEIHKGIFAVMDGTVCGNGAGPRTMEPFEGNRILASEDQVAIDAISAKMMGFDPLKIPFIKMCHERGLGCGDPDQIDVVGDDINQINYNFHTGKSLVVWADQLFRRGALKFLEPILFHTPLFKLCILCSAGYHDYVWYPLVGKRIIKEFNETKWGKLFQKY
ncbi:MAG: DUF362 domain-containing protein [Candidatus Altiarchaeota archaeon]